MKIAIGDIFELRTKFGLCYGQYSHKVPNWGALFHVFEGVYEERPDDLSKVVTCPVAITTFFPLQYALKRGNVEVVDRREVREDLKCFPYFREYADVDREGNVKSWWVESSSGVLKKSHLTPEEERLPIRAVLNDTALIEFIENHQIKLDTKSSG